MADGTVTAGLMPEYSSSPISRYESRSSSDERTMLFGFSKRHLNEPFSNIFSPLSFSVTNTPVSIPLSSYISTQLDFRLFPSWSVNAGWAPL